MLVHNALGRKLPNQKEFNKKEGSFERVQFLHAFSLDERDFAMTRTVLLLLLASYGDF